VSVLDAKKLLLEYLRKQVSQKTTVAVEPPVNVDVGLSKKSMSIFHKFSVQPSSTDAESEDTKYLGIPADIEASPAEYWSLAQKVFPLVAKLARKLVYYYC